MVAFIAVAIEFLKRRLAQISRLKLLIFVFLFAISVCIFWKDFKLPTEIFILSLVKHRNLGQGVSAPACAIPHTPIFPDYFKKHWRPRGSQDCKYESTFIELRDEKEIVLLGNAKQPCCFQEISRGVNDSTYNITDCVPTAELTSLEEREAIFVKCSDGGLNAEAMIPVRDGVSDKLTFWKETSEDERPYSVFIFGFDSISRSHAYRSIPKSLEIMKTMGFVDLQGYHSIAPSTLTNMMGFLMGLTRPEVRGNCAKDWETPFDDCPFVWKDFSDMNYVTMYLEDGNQTFNWGGQSGFMEPPTDYYLHHMFLALTELRQEQVKNLHLDLRKRNVSMDCTSGETVPEFMLRYSERFLRKFAKFPFFAFTWFGYPFHEDVYSLASMDNKLLRFFQSIQSQPELLQRSIIIFLSDHGDRTSFFNSMSIESYIERGLPPLFIRLPDRLQKNHPEMARAILSNAGQLTTPFDIHHTLLHILSMNSRLESGEVFEPQLKDRASLLTSVGNRRNCSSTNIPATNCLCNVQYHAEESYSGSSFKANNGFKARALKFVVDKLNFKVRQSKYKGECEKWYTKNLKDVIYARKIGQGVETTEFIFAFQAWPGQAKFEARFVARLKPKLAFKELAGFARINRYGDQSWCVGSSSDSDKEMKELCICKEHL